MTGRIFKISEKLPVKGKTSLEVVFRSDIHEIHLWRVTSGDWIYPHIHPYNDDIWYIIQGTGEYYMTSEETKTVMPGDIAVAKPGDVHGLYNSGPDDMIVYSVLSPLPVEFAEAPGFNYPDQ